MARAASASGHKPSTWSRLKRLIGGEEEAVTAPLLPIPAPMARSEDTGIEALASQLAALIEAAQSRVGNAASIVVRSAAEAQAYREQLSGDAQVLGASSLPVHVAAALIEVTQAMIERTRGAEERLRTMGQDLEVLQQDLDEARCSAERDMLTGLPNRRALEKALTKAVETARVTEAALSLAFCDIDNFKLLNDRHGHALGDRVLRLVGDCLADGAGEEVFVSRQGGEEFVMLFEGLPADEAALKVDAIRADLASRSLKSRTSEAPIGQVSFSAGVAMLESGEGGECLLRRADHALYRAKRAGKNRVEVDPAEEESEMPSPSA